MTDKKNPWGRPSSGGSGNGGGMGGGAPRGPRNPDYEAMLRAKQQKFNDFFGGQGQEKRTALLLAMGALLLWGASGIYRVNPDELGVVLRFGKYERTTTPGLNYHLPAPIEQVLIPSVTTVNKVEIDYAGSREEPPSIRQAKMFGRSAMDGVQAPREGQMLTGDRNIVDIDFEVQWKIDARAPEKFLFQMRDPASSVKAVAESAMREVIGRNKLDAILTSAQAQIAEDAKAIMQKMFDDYDAGIEIVAVNLSRPDVPQPVIDEFQDVKRAEQDKQTAESVAEGYANDILPKAKGDAAKMLLDAQGYKAKVIADAQGDAARFLKVYAEYAQAKDVTRERMYLEMMEQVLPNMPKVIVDKSAQGNGGMMQWLPAPMPRNAAPASTAQ